ncbi:uncharacterized protein [Procambarus clarkii]|uniref:uncharacterized protein n=1 Tax=Procambarus clarkii TaxID=6728 RepID=UPI001E6710FC|nr:uncharacterized protein LOC123754405 [Procambarus clarkii]XP_045592745.1 uncharacterized protein LOC123754405 [Procambarus clarkii]
MRRCCWCCVSLQKGVVAIGVFGMVCASVLTVGYGAVAVTLEEHVTACRQGHARDLLGLLPSCHDLSDTATLLAARIFVYIQVSVWVLFLGFSILLIVGAVKERGGLLVPWLVLSVVVMAAVVWSGVRAALQHRTLDLLASVLAVAVCTYCCLVVRSYSRLIKKEALIPVLVPSTFTHTRMLCENPYAHTGERRELPPAYTAYPRPPTPDKKGPPPTGLGFKI